MSIPVRIKYVCAHRVVSCEERFEESRVPVDKAPDETTAANRQYTVHKRSLGWFVHLEGSSAIGPFPDDPGFKAGDVLRATWEKA